MNMSHGIPIGLYDSHMAWRIFHSLRVEAAVKTIWHFHLLLSRVVRK